jgi:hypothetical protein
MKTGWRLLTAAALVTAAAPGLPSTLAAQPEAERLLIDKSDRTLKILFAGGRVVTLQGLRFGPNWRSGPKRQRGDRKTPEGEYRVLEHRTSREIYPEVTYLPALYLNYPNEQDVEASAMLGVDPGDAIMIHGRIRTCRRASCMPKATGRTAAQRCPPCRWLTWRKSPARARPLRSAVTPRSNAREFSVNPHSRSQPERARRCSV